MNNLALYDNHNGEVRYLATYWLLWAKQISMCILAQLSDPYVRSAQTKQKYFCSWPQETVRSTACVEAAVHRGPRGITLTKKFLSIFFILHWDKKFQKCLYHPNFHFQIGKRDCMMCNKNCMLWKNFHTAPCQILTPLFWSLEKKTSALCRLSNSVH